MVLHFLWYKYLMVVWPDAGIEQIMAARHNFGFISFGERICMKYAASIRRLL